MKRFLLISIFCFIPFCYFSQEGEVIDGIKNKIKKYTTNDSVKVELIIDLAWEYSFYDYRNSIKHCNDAIALSKSINYESGVATAYSIKGNSYRALTIYDSAYYFLNQALQIRKSQGRKNKIAAVTQNLANVYYQEGKTADAITKYKEAIKISEEAGDQKSVLVAITNLASVYRTIGLSKKAIESLNKAFEINKILKDSVQESFLYSTLATLQSDLGNPGQAVKYGLKALELVKRRKDYQNEASIRNNLGMNYRSAGHLRQAFNHYQEAIKLYSVMNDSLSMAAVYNNLANVCMTNDQLEIGLQSSSKALRIAQREGDTVLMYNSLLTIADGYSKSKDFVQALKYANMAKPMVEAVRIKKDLREMYASFSEMYFMMKDYKNASENMVLLLAYTDSINSENNTQLATNLGVEMELNSKEKEIELLNKSAEIKEIELDRQKNIRLFFIGVVFLFAVIIVIGLFSYKRIKKANLIIENQKMEVELKNEEVTHQKELVEEKQKEIIDSINYAKRIQQAVLTGEDVWNKISKEHFILFKPKDIVSGDFYWAYNTPNNRSVFALADCTGHGVPGGFMSMLGNSFLNEIVVENKIFKADQILNKLRSKIINALEQKGGTQQKDGMDMCLCVWNKLDNTLEFAGANNPLWLLRTVVSSSVTLSGVEGQHENKQLIEYKADKMPIGLYLETEKPFTSVTIQLQAGDVIYLSTDGYADQFGGPKGKKLKYKPLIESLIKNSQLDMTVQKTNLETAFSDWKGSHEQVDDVSLIGVKVLS